LSKVNFLKYIYTSSNQGKYGYLMKIVAIKQQNNEYVTKKRQKTCEEIPN